jgi:ribosomal subunit interface protein
MRLIIKARKNLEIPENLRKYAEDKIKKFENRIPRFALVEIEFADTRGPKGGLDKVVHITADLFDSPEKIIHLTERTEDFRKSIDLIQEKFEREITQHKEKQTF